MNSASRSLNWQDVNVLVTIVTELHGIDRTHADCCNTDDVLPPFAGERQALPPFGSLIKGLAPSDTLTGSDLTQSEQDVASDPRTLHVLCMTIHMTNILNVDLPLPIVVIMIRCRQSEQQPHKSC